MTESNVSSAAADVERTRAEIGETVHALAAKTDVKARARQKAGQVRRRFAGRAGSAETVPAARRSGAGVAVLATAAVAAAVLWRRRRAQQHTTWRRASRSRAGTLRARASRGRAGTLRARASRGRTPIRLRG